MITATLPTLPDGRPYTALGVVGGIGSTSPGPAALAAARRQMEAEAEALGADAVIDVHLQMVPMEYAGQMGYAQIALIGTAVKFLP